MGEILTEEGYQKLKEELKYLKTVKRREISKIIGEARAHGDIRENAEYHAAKDEQGMIEAKIRQLETRLASATILDEESIPEGVVFVGSTVKLQDLNENIEITYTLVVGPSEVNLALGKISVASPVAKGLLGKKVGDVVEINVPVGTLKYKILNISR